jgi:2-amino-4-hydroxy-6-hydroxymethyldihydropteridine diphosphokinase
MLSKKVYLSLGSNLGQREEKLECAIQAIEKEQIHVRERSSVYETEPQEIKEQPLFLNMVVECETHYFPIQLLVILQRVERELGRVRLGPRKGPRAIDIDILLFSNVVMETVPLVIPHPRMLERRFMLEPLLEIAPDFQHPKSKEPLSRFLSSVAGQKLRKV